MRSGLIFRASDHISNRFLLCRMISASARKMHRDGTSTSQSINRSLAALDGAAQHSPDGQKPDAPRPSGAGDPAPDARKSEPTPAVR